MNKPFKHAGGCQIFQNYLAVGIEDNDAKNKSKVCIFEILNPENPPVKPVAIIERRGEAYRSTAGCVGITKYKNDLLLAVGDWDTKHIDFYSCKFTRMENDEFKLISTVELAGISRKDWIDDSWSAYQNINLFAFNNNELYLVGLGQNSANENVADLFRLTETEPGKFNFKKIATKKFDCENEVSFKAAAGMVVTNNNEFSIISCGYHIEDKTFLNCFEINNNNNNKMKFKKAFGFSLFLLVIFGCANNKAEKVRVWPAHSHNDYEHERPLFDALDYHFKSVEADIYSVGDSLFVAHDFIQIKPGRTLQNLYLDPLKKRIDENNGSVYGNGEEIILLVDIKDDAKSTYQLLDKILQNYAGILTVFQNGQKKKGSVMVVISGNRPFKYMSNQTIRYAGFDGRLENLDSGVSPGLMPMVSDNWAKYFTWDGTGRMPSDEKILLQTFAGKASSEGYILRFWNTPNQSPEMRVAVWTELMDAGVGLIGADQLKELEEFFMEKM